jgi:hypothetical protein
MRKLILATLAAVALTYGGAAFAQSQQGGYLGQNPGGQQSASAAAPARIGASGQGGYLGQNPGGGLKPASRPAEADMRNSPTAWCTKSPEPYRCRSRAAVEHEMCVTKDPQYYASCRFALDQMHGQ